MLNFFFNFSFVMCRQVIRCEVTEVLPLFKQKSFLIESTKLLNAEKITAPRCCKLFVLHAASRQLHGVYLLSSLEEVRASFYFILISTFHMSRYV